MSEETNPTIIGAETLTPTPMLVKKKSIANTVLSELGLISLWNSPRDVKLLCGQRFVRMLGYGVSTLILVAYLDALGIKKTKIGLFMTLTLAGDICISFFLTLFADALGRRATLALGALLMTASGVVFALFGTYWILLVAAIVGVISPKYVTWPTCFALPVGLNSEYYLLR
jgi:MFS family permease